MRTIITLLAATLTLAGCGGGGGGGGPPRGDTDLSTLGGAYSVAPAQTRATAATAAGSLPRFGSTTQSSNRDASGITTDTASIRFNGDDVSLTVSRQGRSGLQLDSAIHTDPGGTQILESPIPGHTLRSWEMVRDSSTTSLSVGYTVVSWDRSDPTDYLSGGLWMHATGDLNARRIDGVETGAFIDGPELDGTPRGLSVLGTASYEGDAVGVYAYERSNGAVEIGNYQAGAMLTADFGAGTIHGCIGCNRPMLISGIEADPSGDIDEFTGRQTNARVFLDSVTIEPDGAFRDHGVSIEIEGHTITRSSGAWGGKFSTIPAASGDPRLVAGTNGVQWRESDGSQGALNGMFVGAARAAQ